MTEEILQKCDSKSNKPADLLKIEEKPYKCNQCNYAGSSKKTLTAHMKIHTGVKPFKCSQCGTSFSKSDHLKLHLLTHSGEKSENCTQCTYSCVRGALKSHMKVHIDIKPFICNICTQTQTEPADSHKSTSGTEIIQM